MSATATGDASHNSRWGNVNGWRHTLPLLSHSLRAARLFLGIGVVSSIRILEKQDGLQMSQVLFVNLPIIVATARWPLLTDPLEGVRSVGAVKMMLICGRQRLQGPHPSKFRALIILSSFVLLPT
jgi:hypothetical protein